MVLHLRDKQQKNKPSNGRLRVINGAILFLYVESKDLQEVSQFLNELFLLHDGIDPLEKLVKCGEINATPFDWVGILMLQGLVYKRAGELVDVFKDLDNLSV